MTLLLPREEREAYYVLAPQAVRPKAAAGRDLGEVTGAGALASEVNASRLAGRRRARA
jgi:hypothetical protein